MHLSKKPAIYCIDGLNFVRSFWQGNAGEEENIRHFLDWLEDAASSNRLYSSSFRVIFDGGFRASGPLVRGGIKISFSEHENADTLLLEQAGYLKTAGERAVIVTSDGGLMQEARSSGIKCMPCEKFFDLCQIAINEFSR